MQIGRIGAGLDIGFTDMLVAGGGVGHAGQLAVFATGSSYTLSVTAGVVWCPDSTGSFTGIPNSLVRQVYAGGSVTLNPFEPSGEVIHGRTDVIVARANGGWGAAPSILVRQGTPSFASAATDLIGTTIQPGDVPLCAVAARNRQAPVAFGGDGSLGDLRRLAADLTPAGICKPWAGVQPPIGYKVCDGTSYGSPEAVGPYGPLRAACGAGVPDLRGRVPLGPDNMGPAGAAGRVLILPTSSRSSGGEERHTLSVPEIPPTQIQATNEGGLPPNAFGGAVGFQSIGTGGSSYGMASTTVGSFAWGLHSEGGGGAHNNLQPYEALVWVVKF